MAAEDVFCSLGKHLTFTVRCLQTYSNAFFSLIHKRVNYTNNKISSCIYSRMKRWKWPLSLYIRSHKIVLLLSVMVRKIIVVFESRQHFSNVTYSKVIKTDPVPSSRWTNLCYQNTFVLPIDKQTRHSGR